MEEKTYYAPAKRSSAEEILQKHKIVGLQKFFNEIFGALTGIGAVIDKNRQIVYANNDFLALLGLKTLEPILGKRLGEAVSCMHSEKASAGCGTSMTCAYCGAVNAILESQKTGQKSVKETRISTVVGGKLKSLDLNITSAPITLDGQVFYALILQDISDEKRRSALERIFFHDLMNSACGLNGLLTILKEGTAPEAGRELINLSEEASRDIIEEITLQRQIRSAEDGDLQVNIGLTNSIDLLESAIGKIGSHESGENKHIVIADNSANIDFETDRTLFQRVIINLLKNAFEATPVEGTVVSGVESKGSKVRFWVKNDQVIPEDVQMQIFQRSFSTKGSGRGIGTYSIRLLTENYLKGNVSFISNEKDGTIFSVELNKSWAGK
jgi:K+-sensing histidine kinase KdpD